MKKFTILIAVLAMIAMAMPAAADPQWDFYGSARVATFWADTDLPDGVLTLGGDDDDADTVWAVQGNSRIGANVKVSDTLSGRFEYGSGPNLRLLYGTWNFGAGSLRAGQMYTPLTKLISNQVFASDNDLVGVGGLYTGRQGGLMLTVGDFKLGLYTPAGQTLGAVGDIDYIIPKIEVSYHLALGKAYIDFVGAYQTYDVETVGNDFDVDSWILGMGAGVNLGTFYIKSTGYYAENLGNYGNGMFNIASGTSNDSAVLVGTSVEDNETWGVVLVAGAKVSDMVTVEGGFGYVEAESDLAGTQDDDAMSYYVNASITLAPGVLMVPEVGVLDGADGRVNGTDGQKTTYFGVKWQINF
jgi:hypothetical protein